MSKPIIAFIGAGNMARSFISGMVSNNYPSSNIWATNRNKEKLQPLKNDYRVHVTTDNLEAITQADVVVLCVKPQKLHPLTQSIQSTIQEHKPLVISIAAGIAMKDIIRWLGGGIAMVRCMPNTPAQMGCGATGMYANELVAEEQKVIVTDIMQSVGIAMWLPEEAMIDTVTALSGSGPAYFFLVMEALEQSAQGLGLPKSVARALTLQTALGAARMAQETGESLATLRKQVTSPGGVTEPALRALEAGNIRQLFAYALHESHRRAQEIAHQFGQQ